MIAELEQAGFTLGIAFEGKDGVPVYSVSRGGFQSYVRGDDQATIDALTNPPVSPAPETAMPDVAPPVPLDPTTATLDDVIAVVNHLIGAN